MATALFMVAEEPGMWSFQIEYNDQNNKATALYCENQSSWSVWGWCMFADGSEFERTFTPGVSRVNFPANVVTLTQLVSDGETILWPVPITRLAVSVNY